jgi:hypothetical protein
MTRKAIPAMLVAATLGVSPLAAFAQTLPGDHLIVPGVRIGGGLLEQADQGALVRDLGEPDETIQRGDYAYYVYKAPQPDTPPPASSSFGGSSGGAPAKAPPPPAPPPDELMIQFDLNKDAPFEISTASPFYRTRDGLGVGSTAAEVRAALGAPLCAGGTPGGAGLLVYGAVWFLTAQGSVARVSIRKALSPADFQTGPVHC